MLLNSVEALGTPSSGGKLMSPTGGLRRVGGSGWGLAGLWRRSLWGLTTLGWLTWPLRGGLSRLLLLLNAVLY